MFSFNEADQKKEIIAINLPDSRFKAMISKYYGTNITHEILREMYFTKNTYSWDDILAYEIYLQHKQIETPQIFSMPLWEALCKRDYPNIILDNETNARNIYLSQQNVLEKASKLAQQDPKLLPELYQLQPEERKWQYSIESLIDRVKQNYRCLATVSPAIRNNKIIMRLAINQNIWALEYASNEIRDNYDIVMAAVRQNGNVLEYASDNLRNNYYIVMAAIKQHSSALQYASKYLRGNHVVVIAAVMQFCSALRYASENLRNDKCFMLEVVQLDGLALEYAPAELRNDYRVVMTAVKRNLLALKYASKNLLNNKKFILEVVKNNCLALKFIPQVFRDDQDIVLAAFKQNKESLQFASPRFKDILKLETLEDFDDISLDIFDFRY